LFLICLEVIKSISYICRVVQIKTFYMATNKSYKEKKEEREDQIVEYYTILRFSGLSVEDATLLVMEKFSIFSRTTVWSIRKRVEKRNAQKQ